MLLCLEVEIPRNFSWMVYKKVLTMVIITTMELPNHLPSVLHLMLPLYLLDILMKLEFLTLQDIPQHLLPAMEHSKVILIPYSCSTLMDLIMQLIHKTGLVLRTLLLVNSLTMVQSLKLQELMAAL